MHTSMNASTHGINTHTVKRWLSMSMVSISILLTTACSTTDQRGRDVISQYMSTPETVTDYGARLPNNIGDYERFCTNREWLCR